MPAAIHDSPNKIFVGNMPKSWDEAKMESTFEKFGKITEVTLMKNKESGESRGFGFIVYENTDDANDAIEAMNSKEVDGVQLKVDGALKSLHANNPGGGRGRGGFRGGMRGGPMRGRGGPLLRGGPRGGFGLRGGPPRGGFMLRGRGGPPSRGMGRGGDPHGRGGPPSRGGGHGGYEASMGGPRGAPRGGPRGALRGSPRGGPPPPARGRGGAGRTLLGRLPRDDVDQDEAFGASRGRTLLGKEPLLSAPGGSDFRPTREPLGRTLEREPDSFRESAHSRSGMLPTSAADYLKPSGPSYRERSLVSTHRAEWDVSLPARHEPLLRERDGRSAPTLDRLGDRPRSSFPPEREAAYPSRSSAQFVEDTYGRSARDEYPPGRSASSFDYAETRASRSDYAPDPYRRDPYTAPSSSSSDLAPSRPARESYLDREFGSSSRSSDPYGAATSTALARGYGGREAALTRDLPLSRETPRARDPLGARDYTAPRAAATREYGETRTEEGVREFARSARGAFPEERPAASFSARYYDEYEKAGSRGYGIETYGSVRDPAGSATSSRAGYSSRDLYPSGRGDRAEKPGYGDPYRATPSAYGGRSAPSDRNGAGLPSRPYSRY